MSDENTIGFRTAVGGFHKGDVSAYIAKTAAAHQAQIEELTSTVEKLRTENESLKKELEAAKAAPIPEEVKAAAPEPVEAPQPVPESAPEAAPADPTMKERELGAYRRAEAAERLAYQRARKLYDDMQVICEGSAEQLGTMDTTAKNAMDVINQQLDVIQSSLTDLYQSVQTSSESIRAMGALIPDPAEGLEEL